MYKIWNAKINTPVSILDNEQELSYTSIENYSRLDFAKDFTLCVLVYTQPGRGINLPPTKIQNLDDVACDNIRDSIDQIHPKPEWFVMDDYLKSWKNNFKKFLLNNNHKKLLDPMRFRDTWPEDVADILGRLVKIMDDEYENWHRISMKGFFESNLPLELYNLYTISYRQRAYAMQYFEESLRTIQPEFYMHRGNNQKMKKVLYNFVEQHKEVQQALLKTLHSEFALVFYLKLSNAEKPNDLFKNLPIISKNNDEFIRYMGEFKQNLSKLTVLMSRNRTDTIILSSPRLNAFEGLGEELRRVIVDS